MLTGLRAFLTDLIDYAGLFPPAKLDLEPAITNHARYRQDPDAWMLGRFIIPGARLSELDPWVSLFEDDPPARLSVLGIAADSGELEVSARTTIEAAREFEARHHGLVRCDRFELRASLRDVGPLARILGSLSLRSDDGVAVELPLVGDTYSPEAMEEAAAAIAEANARARGSQFALKLRCGGVTPDLVPSIETVAHAVAACRDAGAAFKATAGLHHPLRNDDSAVGATMHGFVNLFGAACLANAHGLDQDALAEVLYDRDPALFHLGDDFAWRGHRVDASGVYETRQRLALSYGSCSFDEPREDLREMGWLPPV